MTLKSVSLTVDTWELANMLQKKVPQDTAREP